MTSQSSNMQSSNLIPILVSTTPEELAWPMWLSWLCLSLFPPPPLHLQWDVETQFVAMYSKAVIPNCLLLKFLLIQASRTFGDCTVYCKRTFVISSGTFLPPPHIYWIESSSPINLNINWLWLSFYFPLLCSSHEIQADASSCLWISYPTVA